MQQERLCSSADHSPAITHPINMLKVIASTSFTTRATIRSIVDTIVEKLHKPGVELSYIAKTNNTIN